jgi:inhibitor of KinA sporulation pathway (predicted exonuclease)
MLMGNNMGNNMSGLKDVLIDKIELIATLTKNMKQHEVDFIETMKDYDTTLVRVCKSNLKIAKKNVNNAMADGRTFESFLDIPSAPREYSNEYNKAIRMFKMSVDSEIYLTPEVFNQLILDEWVWKTDFLRSKTHYNLQASI